MVRHTGGGDCFLAPDAGGRFQVRRGDRHSAHRRRSGAVVPDRMGGKPPQPLNITFTWLTDMLAFDYIAGIWGNNLTRIIWSMSDDEVRMGYRKSCGELAQAWGIIRRSRNGIPRPASALRPRSRSFDGRAALHYFRNIQPRTIACGLPHPSPRSHSHYQRTPCHPCRKEAV